MRQHLTEMGSFKFALAAAATFLALNFAILLCPAQSISAAPKATITVDTTSETSSAGHCTLRDAILAANAGTTRFNCVGSGGADSIGFSTAGTIVLTGTLPVIAQDLTIDGGGSITISGNSLYQIVSVSSTINLNLIGLRFQNGNSGVLPGGAISNAGNLAITNTTFISNSASNYGGAIENANGSGLTVVNSTFSNNSSFNGGGAIDTNPMPNISILNSTFSNNSTAIDHGGAIYIFNITNATIANSSFVNNTAGGLGEGGGVRIEAGSFTVITNSSFTRNNAESGAAISNNGSTTLITNTTMSGNKSNKDGGGIQNANSATTTLNNVTLATNVADYNNDTAGNGGGIYSEGGSTLNLKNTILAKNNDLGNEAPDCQGALTTLGNNLLGDDTLCTGLTDGASGDKVGTGGSPKDPKLGPLGYYGGSTLVHSLLTGSLALNAGSNSTCASTDQRGVVRPLTGGNPCDMGAYEGVGYGLYFPLIFR